MGIPPMVHRLEAGATRRASMLLEVLVTVTIMAMFMALIGAQILAAVQAAGLIERRQTSMLLAESITGRLQAGGFELTDQAQQMAGTFGTVYPGWGWRVGAEPTDDPTLMRVHLQVLQGDPAVPDASVDSMTAITDMYTFWALPAKMDLVEDFGLSESDAAALAAKTGIDPKNFDPAMLAGLNIADLLKEYPDLERLLAMYGIDPSMLATLDPETIKKGLEAYMASGGTIPNPPSGGGTGGGGNNGTDNNGGASGGNDTNNNGSNNNNNNESGGSFDMSEVVKMLSAGDKAGAEAYIRAHESELNNKGGGTSGSGNAGGNTGSAGGSGKTGSTGGSGGNTGNAGGSGRRGAGNNTGSTGGNRGSRGGGRVR
jgi:type II secretory pathway pseudopilin PulG